MDEELTMAPASKRTKSECATRGLGGGSSRILKNRTQGAKRGVAWHLPAHTVSPSTTYARHNCHPFARLAQSALPILSHVVSS